MSERGTRSRVWLVWLCGFGGAVLLLGSCLYAVSRIQLTPFRLSDGSNELPAPPPAKDYGTAREIGTRGDSPNPRALYHGEYPSDDQTQERSVGGSPARFSGYTTWVRSVTRVPAHTFVDGYPGFYLRVNVTVFNRDTETQHVCACDFYVWTRAAGGREADAVAAPTLSPDATMRSGARRDGNVYLYVGTVPGPYFVVYKPDAHVPGSSSTARGVWRVPLTLATRAVPPTTPTAPPSTRV